MKEIPDCNGHYLIDRAGNVYSKTRNVVGKDGVTYPKKGKKLKPFVNKQTGYPQVDLWVNNKGTRYYIHRLVAEAYIPNPENKPEVNHKNSNRQDCAISNLEWATSSENSIHAYTYGYASQKERRKLAEQDYSIIFSRFLEGESFESILRDYPISAGRLSMNLRALVTKWGRFNEYVLERQRQRKERAILNGSN